MAERKDGEEAGREASATPPGGQSEPQGRSESYRGITSALPRVDSPPLSPAGATAPVADVPLGEPAVAPEIETLKAEKFDAESNPPPASHARLRLRPRHKRRIVLAASVAIAASLGAGIGALASGAFSPKPRTDVVALNERKAMQQSLAHLSKQVAALKADLDKANKSTHSRIAKIAGRIESALIPAPAPAPAQARNQTQTPASEVTGSIPQQKAAADVPLPRPAPQIAATESRPVVVPDWSIRDARGGYVYVQGHGDIYQVVPGAYLPGLGPVQSIERKDGHWAVVTPRGLIVSMRDRRYFE